MFHKMHNCFKKIIVKKKKKDKISILDQFMKEYVK